MDQLPATQDDIDNIFCDAIEMPSSERLEWLHARCGNNQKLINEVKSLLTAHDESGQFLNETRNFALEMSAATDYSGTQIGPWRLKHLIGSGGMSRVYLGERADGAYEQTVAIKVGTADGVNSELLKRERQALAEIEHPAITRIIDAGDIDNSSDAYLVMEYIAGCTLTEYLNREYLSPRSGATIMCTILDVLQKAHEKGVLHCDIKPGNVMVSENAIPRLLDFGISQVASSQSVEQVQGMTPSFASPQRREGQEPTVSDDIYSCGLLFKLLLKNIYVAPKTTSNAVGSCAVPAEPAAILKRATASDPADRYPSAGAFRLDLENWLAGRPVNAMHGGPVYRFQKLLKRHYLGSALAMSAILVAGLTGMVWLQQQRAAVRMIDQHVQTSVALSLADGIKSLDFQFGELPGAINARLASYENLLKQLELLHRQQPDNPEIMFALGQSLLYRSEFYFQPAKMHLAKIEEGHHGIRRAYELLYQSYRLNPGPETLAGLVRATNRVYANRMSTERNWRAVYPFIKELADEYRKKYLGQNQSADNASRMQLVSQFLFHLPEGNFDEARNLLDQALAFEVPDADSLSELDKRRLNRQNMRIEVLDAYYYLAIDDLSQAEEKFTLSVNAFKNARNWPDKARALYAYRGLACVSLLRHPAEPVKASDYLNQARAMVAEFQEKNSSAVNLMWEIAALDKLISQVESADQSTISALISSASANNTLSCKNPGLLYLPASPPEGWESVAGRDSYKKLISVLKSIH